MRMAALSGASGIPVATIKFYLREGLLHAGARTSPNQSQYDTTHVHRLRLIRALTEVGGMSIAATGDVLAVIDRPDLPMQLVVGIAQTAARSPISLVSEEDLTRGAVLIDSVITDCGWEILESSAAKDEATRIVATSIALGLEHSIDVLASYAQAAHIMAKADLDSAYKAVDRDAMVQTVVVGTILGDVLIAALRRMAQSDYSGRLPDTPTRAAAPPSI